ncbi:MAG: hypothetical protein AAF768_06440 [Pseudomonadota bacterium]
MSSTVFVANFEVDFMLPVIVWMARLAFVALLVLITVLAFVSNDETSAVMDLVPWDKAQHFIAYYVLGGVALVAFPRLPAVVLLLLLFTQSALVEAAQPYFARDRDIWDLVANSAGLIGIYAPVVIIRLRWHIFSKGQTDIIGANLAAGRGEV